MSMVTHVLPQNSGDIDGTTFASPTAVTPGRLAAFNALTGAPAALNAAAPAEVLLVLGHASQPIMPAPFKKADAIITKKAYAAPVKQRNAITIPTGPVGGSDYNVKVRVIRASANIGVPVDGAEPFHTTNFTVRVPASQAAETTINALLNLVNSSSVVRPYLGRSNKVMTITLTGTSGTANINVGGVNYLATFATDLTTTGNNFVTTHAAAILAAAGVTVTAAAGVITFTATTGNFADVTIATVSGNLSGSVATSQAATQLVIVARNNYVVFVTAIEGFTGTTTVTAPEDGSGEGSRLREIEEETRGTFSDYYQETGLLGSNQDRPDLNVVASNNYLLYSILVPTNAEPSVNRPFEKVELLVALNSTVSGNLDTFFGL